MAGDTLSLVSHSAVMTEALGYALGPWLPLGAVAALCGDLAAGKTCFTRGLVRRLAPDAAVSSPTFTIVNEYKGVAIVYHVDLYRLDSLDDVRGIGYEELFAPRDGITIVEWAERAESLLPKRRVDIAFEHGGGDQRRIAFTNRGLLEDGWRAALQDVPA